MVFGPDREGGPEVKGGWQREGPVGEEERRGDWRGTGLREAGPVGEEERRGDWRGTGLREAGPVGGGEVGEGDR